MLEMFRSSDEEKSIGVLEMEMETSSGKILTDRILIGLPNAERTFC